VVAQNSASPELALARGKHSGKSTSRPRSPRHGTAVSASPEPALGRRTTLSPASVKGCGNRGDVSIQCNYLPHVTPESNRSNRTTVMSTFNDYDDACPEIMATAPPHCLLGSNNSRWDARTTEHGPTLRKKLRLAQSRLQPRSKHCLARAQPRPTAPPTL
jgi:hypothetical protein